MPSKTASRLRIPKCKGERPNEALAARTSSCTLESRPMVMEGDRSLSTPTGRKTLVDSSPR
ncbi:hypothetical protein PtrSN002B_003689 [Pyrenophora tritici-repentis]|uniref:Uncharacterized protein n=1 Tax=Pyrenophora tritici-repentis (strain Pt-1C-BFP) TaxID=426418 RepID=B2W345_PYRTR|nr:uncharacterized protein PTRG_03843 [Pyrenophora tritici-repentis Pt-1C-BFP]KAA8620100.1 hypothetical protein PtrV1_07194 [Pyrenophora tritici-repentis]EDU46681.1 predicted protein [Pyrenophora tritici-repentis Pt-1C-BFP]KAI0585546.1 hypothetical protein Alg215_02494 [Pyrenophora tritici-repentis]KAI1544618.1 hypothetical protein PtrSN001C_003470 [Pyrenophora tritici-repentis]KAI1550945.1 hypothetical protein PtrSN001A_000165 [Pyrenophora tritici-repentis]